MRYPSISTSKMDYLICGFSVKLTCGFLAAEMIKENCQNSILFITLSYALLLEIISTERMLN